MRTQSGVVKQGGLDPDRIWFRYLGIVDDPAAATDSLTSCLVALGRLARGAAEAAGLMPAQQSLTLQDPTEELT